MTAVIYLFPRRRRSVVEHRRLVRDEHHARVLLFTPTHADVSDAVPKSWNGVRPIVLNDEPA